MRLLWVREHLLNLVLQGTRRRRSALLEQRVLVREFCRFLPQFGRKDFGEICLAFQTGDLRLGSQHRSRASAGWALCCSIQSASVACLPSFGRQAPKS